MSAKVIVFVSDSDDPKYGEITVLEDPRKAERLIETLLEAGFEQARVRVFSGAATDMRVAYRPVVAFVDGDGDAGQTEPQSAVVDQPEEPHTKAAPPGSKRAKTKFSSIFGSA